VQVCWHKACKYFEIEAREAHVSDDCLVLTADRAKPLIDADTIGVCFNGEYENVKEIHDMVVSYAVTKTAFTCCGVSDVARVAYSGAEWL
jgi:glutamate/tyrosine decarboxylase-like PLP-dependent enzyme